MFVVIGEALIDIVESGGTRSDAVGGGPLNVAVGLSRLDQPAALITQIGNDDYAKLIAAHLAASDVELVASPTSTGRTNTAVAHIDAQGVASYSFDVEWTLPHQELPACDAMYVGSLGTTLEPGRNTVVDLVEQAWQRDVFVAFDPNLRAQFLTDAAQTWSDLESLAERCNLVKLSSEDISLVHPGADPGDIARTLLGSSTELVVVTDGEHGSWAYTANASAHVPTPQVDVVDTVGAGDSFMAALLAELADRGALNTSGGGIPTDEASLTELISGAATAAAITCSRRGADPPHRNELPDGWPASSVG